MRKFVRGILIGLCILSGYGLVEASDQVDTIDVCYRQKENIKAGIIKDTFDAFRKVDSSSIVKKDPIGKNPRYEVKYRNYQLEFKWDSITQCTVTDFNSVIGSATSDYRDQIIYCTITYIREIRFKNPKIDEAYYNSEKAIQEDDLLGNTKTNDYPKFTLTSKRKWPVVIRIKKKLAEREIFDIEGDRCLLDGKTTTLSVSEWFKGMNCTWESIGNNDSLSSKTAREITVTRTNDKILATTVSCEISDGCGSVPIKESIKLLPDKTPKSTIKVDIPGGDCLSTSTFFGPSTVPVTASNPVSGVEFYWDTDVVNVQHDNTAKTFNYPIPGPDDFTIRLKTSGGCISDYTSKVVHRKLDNNVVLQVAESSITLGDWFHISTDPELPNMDLQWIIPMEFQMFSTGVGRKDQPTIRKRITSKNPSTITVTNKVCGGSVSTEVTVLDK